MNNPQRAIVSLAQRRGNCVVTTALFYADARVCGPITWINWIRPASRGGGQRCKRSPSPPVFTDAAQNGAGLFAAPVSNLQERDGQSFGRGILATAVDPEGVPHRAGPVAQSPAISTDQGGDEL